MKINHVLTKPIQFLLEDPDEGTGNVALDVLGDVPGKAGSETEVEATETETETEKPDHGFDHEALAKHLEPVLAKLVPARTEPKQEEKKWTPEEAKKMLNIFEPDDEFVSKLNNVETAKEAITILRDALTKQNITIVKMMMEERFGQFDGKINPLLQAHQEAQAKAVQDKFDSAYPQIADPAYKPILTAVLTSLAQSGQKFDSQEKLFAAAAKGVEAVIQKHDANFKITGAKAPTTKPGNPNALPVARPGAAKGGGGQKAENTGTQTKNVVLDVLGKVR